MGKQKGCTQTNGRAKKGETELKGSYKEVLKKKKAKKGRDNKGQIQNFLFFDPIIDHHMKKYLKFSRARRCRPGLSS